MHGLAALHQPDISEHLRNIGAARRMRKAMLPQQARSCSGVPALTGFSGGFIPLTRDLNRRPLSLTRDHWEEIVITAKSPTIFGSGSEISGAYPTDSY